MYDTKKYKINFCGFSRSADIVRSNNIIFCQNSQRRLKKGSRLLVCRCRCVKFTWNLILQLCAEQKKMEICVECRDTYLHGCEGKSEREGKINILASNFIIHLRKTARNSRECASRFEFLVALIFCFLAVCSSSWHCVWESFFKLSTLLLFFGFFFRFLTRQHNTLNDQVRSNSIADAIRSIKLNLEINYQLMKGKLIWALATLNKIASNLT